MSKQSRVVIDGIGFDAITQAQALELAVEHIRKPGGKSWLVAKPYVEFFDGARRDVKVAKALVEADLVLADSVAVQWAASWLAEPKPTLGRWAWSLAVGLRRPEWLARVIPERGEGANATHKWLLVAAEHGWRVGVLGGPRETTSTEEALRQRYGLLQLEGVWSGYYDASDGAGEAEIVRDIRRAKLDVLFVAMGFPRQELFMARHRKEGLAKVLVGEGGTFDYDQMGGRHRRAPAWMRANGLEWAWRLILQPLRIRRMWVIPRFIWRMYWVAQKKAGPDRK